MAMLKRYKANYVRDHVDFRSGDGNGLLRFLVRSHMVTVRVIADDEHAHDFDIPMNELAPLLESIRDKVTEVTGV